MLRKYYPHFLEISTSCGYYPHLVAIIYIDRITSYLARNVCPICHIYSFNESDWCNLSMGNNDPTNHITLVLVRIPVKNQTD